MRRWTQARAGLSAERFLLPLLCVHVTQPLGAVDDAVKRVPTELQLLRRSALPLEPHEVRHEHAIGLAGGAAAGGREALLELPADTSFEAVCAWHLEPPPQCFGFRAGRMRSRVVITRDLGLQGHIAEIGGFEASSAGS